MSFRAHTLKKATELGLTGRATNLPDASVEVMAQGDKESLEALLKWLHKGPILARVDSVQWDQVELNLSESGFIRN